MTGQPRCGRLRSPGSAALRAARLAAIWADSESAELPMSAHPQRRTRGGGSTQFQ